MIHNCPVTVEDIVIAKNIWGKDISYLKGKTTRTTPKPVVHDTVEIPMEIKRYYIVHGYNIYKWD